MGTASHQHDWAACIGGYRCLLCGCTLTDAEVGTNIQGVSRDHNGNLNHALKKAGRQP